MLTLLQLLRWNRLKGKIISAVRTDEEFERALNSKTDTIFFLNPDIFELKYVSAKAHEKGKKIFIHIDLTLGLGKDKSGIEYAKALGVDGIISTRANLIKIAKELDLKTVQRFFIVDSHSIDTTIGTIKSDMIEIMPGVVPKVIKKLKETIDIPIIAGGLIETKEEVNSAIAHGAYAISTGNEQLWDLQ